MKPQQILFYGDSLVFGKKPVVLERFEKDVRFTGVAQKILGTDFTIIEEGLRARNLSGENPFFVDRDGLVQFSAIMSSHLPLDLVIIMLGTNDCNKSSEKSADEISLALDSYREKIKSACAFFGGVALPRLLIVSPPHIRGSEADKDSRMKNIFGSDAEERSKKLATIYAEYCQKNNIAFFDAATVCSTADGEGIHLDIENNRKLGEALAKQIKNSQAL